MNSRKTKNLKNRAPRSARTTKQSSLTHPPAIEGFEVVHHTKLRFTTGAAFGGNITYQNLLDTLCIATTAIAPFALFQFVKVKQLELWSIAALGTASTLTCSFDGSTAGSQGDLVTHTDVSMGIQPAHLRVRPKLDTLASKYQPSSAAVAFYLDIPIGTILDVSLSFKGSAFGSARAAQNASVGATVGQTFWRGLDGVAVAASSFLVPLGVSQY